MGHYVKAIIGGLVTAVVITGLHLLVGVLIKWFSGNPIDQFISIKHLILFVAVLLFSTSYMSLKEAKDN